MMRAQRLKRKRKASQRGRWKKPRTRMATEERKRAGLIPRRISAVRMNGWNALISIRTPMRTECGAMSTARASPMQLTAVRYRASFGGRVGRRAGSSPASRGTGRSSSRGRSGTESVADVMLPLRWPWGFPPFASVRGLGADPVSLELAVEAGAVDSQDRSGELLVPIALGQRLEDVEPLVLVKGEFHGSSLLHRLPDP